MTNDELREEYHAALLDIMSMDDAELMRQRAKEALEKAEQVHE